jgi:hypothetical protein
MDPDAKVETSLTAIGEDSQVDMKVAQGHCIK